MNIPFQINTYETALIEVTKAFNSYYSNQNKRWRIEKSEIKNNSEIYEFKGRVLVEKHNDKTDMYELVRASEEYTVATKHDKEIENYAHCKTMVKFLYFCAQSLDAEISFEFNNENRDKVAKTFKVITSYKAEFEAIKLSVLDVAKFNKLIPFKAFMNSDYPRFPLDQLLKAVKEKRGNDKITMKDVCDFVWGESHSKLSRELARPRKAKKLSGAALKKWEEKHGKAEIKPQTGVIEPPKEQSVRQDVEKEMEALKKLGITKATFAEKCPAMFKKYAHFSVFVANCTDEELFNVKTLG